ncbi:MAG: AIPR family protein [Pseudomonadota bacterium]
MNERKAQFRKELDRFSVEYFETTTDKLGSNGMRSDALTLCYLLSIRNHLLPGAVPDDFEELKKCICDGSSDRTADFIYCDDNNHVTIIQSKHRAHHKDESEADFESFRQCLRKLCPQTRSTEPNQKVLDLIAEIDWETASFTLIFLSLARTSEIISKSVERELDNIPNTPLKDIDVRADIVYLSENKLNEEWRDVIAQRDGVSPTVELLLSESAHDTPYFCFESASGTKSYIALLSAPQIYRLFDGHKEKLFNLNIRNYIGDTRTNKEIMKSAETESDRFFFYNNGLSCVATKVKAEKKDNHHILTCSDFSIINGAQTFRAIAKAHARAKSKSNDTEDLRVLIRVSEFNFKKGQEAEFLDRITRYNNTQNSMKLSDFRSNDAVQGSIVHYMREVPAFKGKKYLYRNKRTGDNERNKISIKLNDFCRAIYSYQFGPSDFFGGQTHLYDTALGGGYVKLFGEDLSALSQDQFDKIFGIWLLTSFCDEFQRQEKKDKSELNKEKEEDDPSVKTRKNALERKLLTFYALGEVLREVCRLKKHDEEDLLRFFSKPRWQEEPSCKLFVKDSFLLGCDMIVQAYQLAQMDPNFVHRNFFRDTKILTTIKSSRASRQCNFTQLVEKFPVKSKGD